MQPLADRMRPTSLEDFVGQKHILDKDKLLYKTIKSGEAFSIIFWGPPGVGKTTLARIIAKEINAKYMEFSAVNSKIADIKKIIEGIAAQPAQQTYPTIFSPIENTPPNKQSPAKHLLFLDEIHRFNKAQQDALLPYVERGTVVLIGATTENPSFEVIGALLSRTRVFVLNQLSNDELKEILFRAIKDKDRGLGSYKISISDRAADALIEGSNGDSRTLLNALEAAVLGKPTNKKLVIDEELVKEALQRKSLMYDRVGEEHYNTISAYIKSMRAGNIDAALYYLARMVEAGEDPLFIARRMVVFASEDIGIAQPSALIIANEVFRACETIGYPECQINLAHGTTVMCQCKKNRTAYDAYFRALEDVKTYGNLPVPMVIRNAPTRLMKELGYGKDYKPYTKETLLPDKLKNRKYFIPNTQSPS